MKISVCCDVPAKEDVNASDEVVYICPICKEKCKVREDKNDYMQ